MGLYGVSRSRPSSVSFHIAGVLGRDAGSGVDIAYQTLLGFTTGVCQSSRFTILVRASVHDDGEDLVVVFQSLVKRFEDEAASAFTSSEARLCSVIESKGLAMLIKKTVIMSTNAPPAHRALLLLAWIKEIRPLTPARTWKSYREAANASLMPRQLLSPSPLSGCSAQLNEVRIAQTNRPCPRRMTGHEG